MWARLERDDEDEVPEIRQKYTGKQPPRKAEGREVAYARAEVEDERSPTNNSMALVDLFGGVSSMRVAAISSERLTAGRY